MYISKKDMCFCTASQGTSVAKFVEIVYERALGFVVDLNSKIVLCPFVVLVPKQTEAILIDKGKLIEVIEIRNRHVFPLVDIGQAVYKDTRLCNIVTKKHEVRVLKSPVRGIVLYIGEAFLVSDKALYIVIAGENDVVKLTRTC